MSVEIVVAASAETGQATEWEDVVLKLTQTIVDGGYSDDYGYGLGGKWSYGTNYSNDAFNIHMYCWCEEDDCPYCGGCQCETDAFWYKVDGNEVPWEEYNQFYEDNVPSWEDNTVPTDEKLRMGKEINKRRESGQHDHLKCDYCNGTRFAEYGQIAGWGVPLFWHKPSGFRMWFYKYLGRDTNIWTPEGFSLTPNDILNDCINSLVPPA